MRHAFEVRPVSGYAGARYPSPHFAAPRPSAAADEAPSRCSFRRLLATAVLTVMLALGLVACFPERHPEAQPDAMPTPMGDGGGPQPDAGGCDDGRTRCGAELTLATCEGGRWQSRACDDVCREDYGPNAYAVGCDTPEPSACTAEGCADPQCLCDYDIIDGDIAACTPGEVTCQDANTIVTCNDDGYSYAVASCDDVCKERLGVNGYSMGCDAAAEDPCQCSDDILDGAVAACTPGDVICSADGRTADVCQPDGYTQLTVTCADQCVMTQGEGSASQGCDVTSEDFCLCRRPTP